MTEADSARLYLLAKSIVSGGNTQTLGGVHEINLFYKLASSADLSPIERNLLTRTLLGDKSDTLPGWRALSLRTRKRTSDILGHYARYDPLAAVRIGAIDLMRAARLRLGSSIDEFNMFVHDLITDDELRPAGIAYFAAVARLSDLKVFDGLTKEATGPILAGVNRAKRIAVYRLRPEQGFRLLLADNNPDDEDIAKLGSVISRISPEALRAGLLHSSPKIRKASVTELFRRNSLSNDDLKILEGEADSTIRELCFLQKIATGEKVDVEAIRAERTPSTLLWSSKQDNIDPARIVRAQFERADREELERRIDWFSVDGPVAYEVLGQRFFSERAATIRTDLSSGFSGLKGQAIAALQQRLAPHIVPVDLVKPELHDFAQDSFIAAALKVILSHGDSSDAQFGRKYLKKKGYFAGPSALEVLARFGDASDVDAIIDVAKSSYGNTKNRAAQAAMDLAPGITGAAPKLIETGDSQCILTALDKLQDESFSALESLVKPLVERKELGLRAIFVWILAKGSRAQIARFLAQYLERDTYYYNVVTWLDRLLFAPTHLRPVYRARLDDAVRTLAPVSLDYPF